MNAVFLLFASALAGPLLALVPEATSWRSGDEVRARIEGKPSEPVFLPACGALQIEVFNSDTSRWEPREGDPCPRTQAAIPLADVFKSQPTMGLKVNVDRFTVARLILVYGVDCQPGLPLDLALCKRFEAAVSPNLSLFVRQD